MADHAALAASLAKMDDAELRLRLQTATPLGDGIGGAASLLQVDGREVFVKRLALTDAERQDANAGTTANLFDLPPHCHYGVGGATWGAWRELAVHQLTTGWVLDGRCDAFPVLHHWRVLSSDAAVGLDCAEHGDVETWVAFWHGSAAVRQRLEALAAASAELVLFLEFKPQNLLAWLTDKLEEGAFEVDVALGRTELQLLQAAEFMAAHGLWHFDAHMRNILIDDTNLYLTDFGLAASSSFDLTAHEQRFLDEHSEHDVAYLVTQLVNWVATRLTDDGRRWTHPRERNEFVARCADGYAPRELLPSAAGILKRYSPVAAVMNEFYFALHVTSRLTPYPAIAVREACAAAEAWPK